MVLQYLYPMTSTGQDVSSGAAEVKTNNATGGTLAAMLRRKASGTKGDPRAEEEAEKYSDDFLGLLLEFCAVRIEFT